MTSDTLVCSTSGLNLVASADRVIYRVSKRARGPIDPPERTAGTPVEKWSRWDTFGRTIYGGSTPSAAFVEVLEYIRPDPPATPLVELFDDVDADDESTLAAQVERELPGCGAMRYRSVSQGWRQDRRLYELRLPPTGWFVDIAGAESISAIDQQCRKLLNDRGIDQLTLSHLSDSGEDAKAVTTGIATWIRNNITHHDGSRPHGIVYPSKWGANYTNWAMWLRRTDDGTGTDPVTITETFDIGKHTADFVAAAGLRGFKIY